MKKVFKLIVIILVLLSMALFVIEPETYLQSAVSGLKLFSLTVVPSLLPFFILTGILTSFNSVLKLSQKLQKLGYRLFKCSGNCVYVFIMSCLSGYPVGAKLTAELCKKGVITAEEGTRMSTFCSTSGPLFIIGCVGSCMYFNKNIGYVILLSHIASAILCGVILNFNKKQITLTNNFAIKQNKTANQLYDIIHSSVISLLCVGGFIVMFYVFADMVKNSGVLILPSQILSCGKIDSQLICNFLIGLIECTRGCLTLSQTVTPMSVSLASSLISFGGLSIIIQSVMFLNQAKTNIKRFLLSKLLQMVLSFCLCYALCVWLIF